MTDPLADLDAFAEADAKADNRYRCRTCTHPDVEALNAGFKKGYKIATLARWTESHEPYIPDATMRSHFRREHHNVV